MNLLITSATLTEISPLLKLLNINLNKNSNPVQFSINHLKITVLITGVGVHTTIFNLTKFLEHNKNFDLAINTGLCGSFSPKIKTGDTVCIAQEQFADIGINDNGEFIPVTQPPLNQYLTPPFDKQILNNDLPCNIQTTHKNVKSITVCTSSGEKNQIQNRQKLFAPDVENMEGAAFFALMEYYRVPFLEIRAVSNFVEPRNRQNWDIPLALSNLASVLYGFLLAL